MPPLGSNPTDEKMGLLHPGRKVHCSQEGHDSTVQRPRQRSWARFSFNRNVPAPQPPPTLGIPTIRRPCHVHWLPSLDP